MLISHIAQKMIRESHGNLHDINHFLKVYAYARTIGVSEGLDPAAQTVLEAAALLHDIACPLCREKYGNTDGAYQEKGGRASGGGLPAGQRPCPRGHRPRGLAGRPPPQPFGRGGARLPHPAGSRLPRQRRREPLSPRRHQERPGASVPHRLRPGAAGRHLFAAVKRFTQKAGAVCQLPPFYFLMSVTAHAREPMGSQGASSMGSADSACRCSSLKKRLWTTAW